MSDYTIFRTKLNPNVLTREKSPYRLIGDVTVAPGVTLTVETGVSSSIREQWLLVKGRIVAQGTSDLPVDFGRDNKRVHGYRGIRLMAMTKCLHLFYQYFTFMSQIMEFI